MTEAQVVALTAELRSSGTSSSQERLSPGDWRVIATSADPVAATTVQDIAARHAVVGETTTAMFEGTGAQIANIEAALKAQGVSHISDPLPGGNWRCRAMAPTPYAIGAVVSLAAQHGVAGSTSRAVFR